MRNCCARLRNGVRDPLTCMVRAVVGSMVGVLVSVVGVCAMPSHDPYHGYQAVVMCGGCASS